MIAKNRKPAAPSAPAFRCAVYTRKSTEDGLEQEFNSLDAQRDAGESYVKSQVAEGWQCLPDHYDDGGFTGGNMDRPALRRLLADIEAGKVDCVVVYKVDRLSRSLLDFARIMETFDKHGVSFVSVILKGLIHCAACGSAMSPSHSTQEGRRYRYLRLPARPKVRLE